MAFVLLLCLLVLFLVRQRHRGKGRKPGKKELKGPRDSGAPWADRG